MFKSIARWIIAKLHDAVTKMENDTVTLKRIAGLICAAVPAGKIPVWISPDMEAAAIYAALIAALQVVDQMVQNIKI